MFLTLGKFVNSLRALRWLETPLNTLATDVVEICVRRWERETLNVTVPYTV